MLIGSHSLALCRVRANSILLYNVGLDLLNGLVDTDLNRLLVVNAEIINATINVDQSQVKCRLPGALSYNCVPKVLRYMSLNLEFF